MTDNELTARIGRKLFGIDVSPATAYTWVIGDDRKVYAQHTGKPDDETIGYLLTNKDRAYATDPKWIGPILIAAAGKGIMVTVESFYRDREDAIGWLVKARDVGKPCDGLYHVDSADLPRTLCRAILAAAGEEVPNA